MLQKKNEISACAEHIDMALDDFVKNNETAPEIIADSENVCCYCENRSDYTVREPVEFL